MGGLVARLTVEMGLDPSGLERGLSRARGELRAADAEMGRMGGGMAAGFHRGASEVERRASGLRGFLSTTLGTAFGVVLAGGVAALGTAVTGLAGSFLMANANAETMRNSLNIAMGDVEAAGRTFEWLQDFAASTPFEFPELMESAVRLESMGISAQETMALIGDTAAAQGRSIGQVTEAYIDATMGQYMRLQELGIDVTDMGDELLVRWVENGQMVERVVADNGTAILGIIQEAWGRYDGAMETQSKTFLGRWATLKDNVNLLMQEMTKGFFEAVKGGLGLVNDWFTAFSELREQGLSPLDAALSALGRVLRETFGNEVHIRVMAIVNAVVRFAATVRDLAVAGFGLLRTVVVEVFGFVREHLGTILPMLKGIGVALAGLLAFGGLSAILGGVGAALAFLLSPIGVLIAAAAVLGLAWERNFLGIRDIVAGIASAIGEFIGALRGGRGFTDALRAIGGEDTPGWIIGLAAWLDRVIPAARLAVRVMLIGFQRVAAVVMGVVDFLGLLWRAFDVGGLDAVLGVIATKLHELFGPEVTRVAITFLRGVFDAVRFLADGFGHLAAAIGAAFRGDWSAVGRELLGLLESLGRAWLALTLQLAKTLWAAFQEIDWTAVGAALWAGLQAAVTWALETLLPWLMGTALPWLTAQAHALFAAIPWDAIGATVLAGIQAALAWVFSLLPGWLGTAIIALAGFVGEVVAFVTQIAEGVAGIVGGIFAAVQLIWETTSTVVATAVAVISGWVQALITVFEGIAGPVETAFNAVVTAIETALETLQGVWDTAKDAITTTVEDIGTAVETAIGGIQGVIEGVGEEIAGAWEGVGTAIETARTTVATSGEAIITMVEGWYGRLTDAFAGIGHTFYGFGRSIVEGLANGIIDWVYSKLAGAIDLIIEQWNRIPAAIRPGSPSKPATEWGRSIPWGLAVGIQRELPRMAGAVSEVVGMVDRMAIPAAGSLRLSAAGAGTLGALPGGLRAGYGGGGTVQHNWSPGAIVVQGENKEPRRIAEEVAAIINLTVDSVEAGALPPRGPGVAA